MKTVWKNLIGACALVGVTTMVTTQVVSQDYGDADQPDPDKMMEAWMKYAAPGPEHAKLATMAGKWDQETKHWMYPGADPSVSHGAATYESILGGRFLLQKLHSKMEFGGEVMEFEGFGIIGYDNMKEKHFFSWIDNMGTLMMIGEGDCNEAGDEITYYSELPNPMTGGTLKHKSVSKTINDNETVFEMYEGQPDGSWRLGMQMTSKRKGHSKGKSGKGLYKRDR